jgi:hypothetical protein
MATGSKFVHCALAYVQLYIGKKADRAVCALGIRTK